MQRYVLYAPLSFASLFLNAAAWRGRGGGGGGGVIIFAFILSLFFTSQERQCTDFIILSLEGRKNEST